MKNKKYIYIAGLILMGLILPLIFAETEIYPLNKDVTLKFTCTSNGAIPSDLATFNITVSYPNGTTFINNKKTTALGNGAFSYNTNFNTIGVYPVQMFCFDGIYSYSDEGIYEVTESGNKIPEGMLIVYGVFIIIVFGISCIFFILAFKIEDSSLKIFFWLGGFVFLTGCMATVTAISYNINPVAAINKLVLAITFIIGVITVLILALVLIQKIVASIDMMREKKGYEA
ncbi:MAG: hypothetical protein EHM47_00955 [Ignavibacteriales bacterium]|nr:MAG: hypothetical protein EHM47_00955 [Ignavibacteriales bacterium]